MQTGTKENWNAYINIRKKRTIRQKLLPESNIYHYIDIYNDKRVIKLRRYVHLTSEPQNTWNKNS